MEPIYFGTEQVTEEDRTYHGSRFSDVRKALFANPYQKIWGAAGEPSLPVYQVTLRSVLHGILPFGKNYRFLEASKRAVDSQADLRWGPDGKGFRRLLHPNAVCLTGRWQITEETEYSGYFEKGREALLVGRYSTCCGETRRGRTRSLSLVGKLFPATDPNHRELLRTANFITQQDIGGDHTDYINDAETRNAPDTTPLAPRQRIADPARYRCCLPLRGQGTHGPATLPNRRTRQARERPYASPTIHASAGRT